MIDLIRHMILYDKIDRYVILYARSYKIDDLI